MGKGAQSENRIRFQYNLLVDFVIVTGLDQTLQK